MTVYTQSSSLRELPPEETLRRARGFAASLGISRIADITRLDHVGVPVFAAIRPGAANGSLCVNAGKGVEPIEAEVGACMEAVEYALAERGRAAVTTLVARARDVLGGASEAAAIVSLCPTMGAQIDLDAPIECVEAQELHEGARLLVPAELVFFPYVVPAGLAAHFGSTTNGLCSGNSVVEATAHGLAELIERDVQSFAAVDDTSVLVAPETFPRVAAGLAERVRAAGLDLFVRATRNSFGIPFFGAVVAEPMADDPLFVCGGYGCHPRPSIAMVRAICEALQSRLSLIHGGRDDLTRIHERRAQMSPRVRAASARKLLDAAASRAGMIAYADAGPAVTDPASCVAVLIAALRANGLQRVLRVVLTRPTDPVQVVRVIVPGLECFNATTRRVGYRLRDHVRTRSA